MEFNSNSFRFYHPLEIRWSDMDALGHVNNVMYIDYFQIGRGYYMNQASKTWDWFKHMFVIANISCNYIKEIKLDVKQPRIGVRISKMGSKSFEIEYAIVSEGENRELILHAIGTSTQVMIDMKEKKTIELPSWMREEITSYEPEL
ncbi:acyl-CoA thioesterase [Myroides marinus]|jgi:acyl-CoA thioester hydrolase|uniref:acyl-CoA thioesterase n=1 Tax=Myroides marinus TaxID=703342 RepID=UPI002578F08A|nr:thioesterase family protein [Myroides marinus]MDR0228636.1 acyl-CoA thioesterase [Flavobacteriaceae bacterium]MDM1348884.1 acyl-CoA thioesterase [Myroides marinus]MDM1352530.1 acyl-CoA thioesterase [Myroides marinus]MDM1354768.1 acyl-CoA thioesterase [Myroides marinus]MDM1359742.1 acyl-CoA thioesterase [Myroides marinus]